MEPIPKSEYFYANRIALTSIQALEGLLGRNGLKAVFNLAHLPQLIDNPPPDDLEKGFNFADFSAMNQALEELYGKRGGHGLALSAGRAVFAEAFCNLGALAGVSDEAFKALPLSVKLKIGIPAMAKVFSSISDQIITVEDLEEEIIYRIQPCSDCWGRTGADKPVCFFTAGLLQEGLKWISGGNEFRVDESKCACMGEAVCEFVIQKSPLQ